MLHLLALLVPVGLAADATCSSGRETFLPLPNLKNPKDGKALYADMDDYHKVDTIEECQAACCAEINGHDAECMGYIFYSGVNFPASGRCRVYFIKYWEHGQRTSIHAAKDGGVSITSMRYTEGACKDESLSKGAKFEDITADHEKGEEGIYSTARWFKDVKDKKACDQLCCENEVFECHGTVFYGADGPTAGNCKLLPLDFQFGKYKVSSKSPVVSLLVDEQCTGSYVKALDHEHPDTGKDVYYDLNEYLPVEEVKSEIACRAKCCGDKYCRGYAYYSGETFPKSGRCRVYYANFWMGTHHVSSHGKIVSKRKKAGTKCNAQDVDTWEYVWNRHGANGWFDVEEWFNTGDEDGCRQSCCDYDGFKCGGYNYYPKGRQSSTGTLQTNCKLMLEGFEYTAKVLDSVKEGGEVTTGVFNHYGKCHDEYEVATPDDADIGDSWFWQAQQWHEDKEISIKNCEKACSNEDACTGYRFYEGESIPSWGRCRMSFVTDFWTGRQLFTKYSIEVFYKTEEGLFAEVPGRAKDVYFSTYEWLRVHSEEGCRNLCCSYPDFECNSYSYYPIATQSNGDDCKLFMNTNDGKVKKSGAKEAPKHGRIKAYMNDQCAAFERQPVRFESVRSWDLDKWRTVDDEDACAKIMCEENMRSYTFYPEGQATQWGNCKIVSGDLTGGIHKPSSKKGLKHGILNGDVLRCAITPVTKHKSGDAAEGFYQAATYTTVNNELECQTACCENTVNFEAGCEAYVYYRPGDKTTNCKLIAQGFLDHAHSFKSKVHTWAVMGRMTGKKSGGGGKGDKGDDEDACGFYMKKVKVKGSVSTDASAADSCECKDACADAAAWVFNVKKSQCQCHDAKKEKKGARVTKVKAANKAKKAKYIASFKEEGDL